MKLTKHNGFVVLEHDVYPPGGVARLAQESSAIGDADGSMYKPGTSFLWIGAEHHLNRSEVRYLVHFLEAWLERGADQ